jgi:hypothetical protein
VFLSLTLSDNRVRYINVLLTALFLWPLLRSRLSNKRLRRLAARTFVYIVFAFIRLLPFADTEWMVLRQCISHGANHIHGVFSHTGILEPVIDTS